MENSHRFFNNRDCKYFPCHKEPKPEEFNCLFCFCPLYSMGRDRGEDCGGIFEYRKGVKLCMDCHLPHMPEYYDVIIDELNSI